MNGFQDYVSHFFCLVHSKWIVLALLIFLVENELLFVLVNFESVPSISDVHAAQPEKHKAWMIIECTCTSSIASILLLGVPGISYT